MTSPVSDTSEPTPYYLQSPEFLALPVSVQDQLIQSAPSTEYLNRLFPSANSPAIPSPSFMFDNSTLFFKTSSNASLAFGQTLDATITADQQLQAQRSLAAANEALVIAQIIAGVENAIKNGAADSQNKATTFQGEINTANGQTAAQQTAINTVNQGSNTDQTQYTNLQNAQTTFTNTITQPPINATLNSDGTYTLPANEPQAGIDAYNSAVNTYNGQIDTFNSYLSSRATAVSTYNAAVATYNAKVSSNNTSFSEFLNQNGLTAEFAADGIDLTQPAASPLSTSFYLQSIPDQATISAGGNIVNIASSIAPPATVTQISSFNPTIPANLQNDIFNNDFAPTINAQQNILNSSLSYYAFLEAQIINTPTNNSNSNPLLNTKPIALKILPNANIAAANPAKTPGGVGASSFSIQSVGLSNPQIQGVLGRANLSQAINNFNLDLSGEQIQQLVQQIQIFQVGQISTNAQSALFPILNALGTNLESIPSTSAAFGVLFALAFANGTLLSAAPLNDNENSGITNQALTTFLQGVPELSSLTPDQISQLAASVNLGQLLLSLKLLENNLGAPGLSSQVLLPLLTPESANAIATAAAQDDASNSTQLLATLNRQFSTQGFPPATTAFLARTGVAVNNNLLTPSPSTVTRTNTNQQLLRNTVAASLVLNNSNITLRQARLAAIEAVRTINAANQGQTNPISTTTFRGQLQNQLTTQGFSFAAAQQAANEAVIVPSRSASLPTPAASAVAPTNAAPNLASNIPPAGTPNFPFATTPNAPFTIPPLSPAATPTFAPASVTPVASATPTGGSTPASPINAPTGTGATPAAATTPTPPATSASSSTPSISPQAPTRPHNQQQLVDFLENQIAQLLLPQLSLEFSKEVTQAVAESLFGSPNPDSSEKAGIKSPNSIITAVKNQISHIVRQKNQKDAEALTASFKETIKNSTDLNTFLVRTMNPAYALVYSANSGIMYSRPVNQPGVTQAFKQSIDMIV